MKFLKRFSKIQRFLVSRTVRDGEHCFSILAGPGGFEYLFPSGVESWSSVGNHHVERFLEPFLSEINRRAAAGKPYRSAEYLNIGTQAFTSWELTEPISYLTREEALEAEIPILDSERLRRPDSRWAERDL